MYSADPNAYYGQQQQQRPIGGVPSYGASSVPPNSMMSPMYSGGPMYGAGPQQQQQGNFFPPPSSAPGGATNNIYCSPPQQQQQQQQGTYGAPMMMMVGGGGGGPYYPPQQQPPQAPYGASVPSYGPPQQPFYGQSAPQPQQTLFHSNAAPQPTASSCPQGHALTFSYVGSNWNCDRCHKQSPPGNSNQCRRCNYDVCAQCVGGPVSNSAPPAAAAASSGVSQTAPPSSASSCPQGHALTFSYVGSNWNCDRCHKQSPPGNSNQCRRCNYDVCTQCIPTAAASLPATAPPPAAAVSGVLSSSTTRPSRTRMLLVGINYTGTGSQLSGCVNDVRNMLQLLNKLSIQPSSPDQLRILVDDPSYPGGRYGDPTRSNIESCLRWLVDGAAPGDSLFFHFSGHGSQVADRTGDEDDGFDETLVPLDYDTRGMITDDYLFTNVCSVIPSGCRLTAVTDCCHSGSVFDLPFVFHPKAAASRLPPKSRDFRLSSSGKTKSCNGDVLLISGCKDAQTSADVSNVAGFFQGGGGAGPKGAGGACSSSLLKVLNTLYGRLSYEEVLEQMLTVLEEGRYSQLPQMSSSKNFDHNKPFSFTGPF